LTWSRPQRTDTECALSRWGLKEADEKLKKWAPTRLYNSVKLCSFCAQVCVLPRLQLSSSLGLLSRELVGQGFLEAQRAYPQECSTFFNTLSPGTSCSQLVVPEVELDFSVTMPKKAPTALLTASKATDMSKYDGAE
jgi:hypothetical protein